MINISRLSQRIFPVCSGIQYQFARLRRPSVTQEDEFEEAQKKHANNYFEQYRKEVEKDSVIREFRKQVFERENQPADLKEYDSKLDKQQRHMESLLKEGSPEQINKYSKKIMQHLSNHRRMFKGLDENNGEKNIFKDYANYSAYTTNKVSYQDRNYGVLDNLAHGKRTQRTYEFVDSLPDDYADKAEAREELQTVFPFEYNELSISEFGKRVQDHHDSMSRVNEGVSEYIQMNRDQSNNPYDNAEQGPTIYSNTEDIINTVQGDEEQTGVMSTEALNSIYSLYLQGWTVREISKRFGILPIRTKFIIWGRARLYNEAIPKFGPKFLIYTYQLEEEEGREHGVCDYGLDLDHMQIGSSYDEITAWVSYRVDTQRTPDKYHESLRKLEKRKPAFLSRYDRVQVGEHGEGNKKHRLVEWRVHRGRGSDEFFLKNKIFNKLMFEGRKVRDVYY